MLRLSSIVDARAPLTRSTAVAAKRRHFCSAKPPSPAAVASVPPNHPGVGKMVKRSEYFKQLQQKKGTTTTNYDVRDGKQLFIRAGLPFILFSLGAWWVVTNAIDGKLKERAMARREVSQSERQAIMEQEHDKMMEKLNKAAKKDFDNTKRIERPEEILARRRAERDQRNVWYRRYFRWIKGEN